MATVSDHQSRLWWPSETEEERFLDIANSCPGMLPRPMTQQDWEIGLCAVGGLPGKRLKMWKRVPRDVSCGQFRNTLDVDLFNAENHGRLVYLGHNSVPLHFPVLSSLVIGRSQIMRVYVRHVSPVAATFVCEVMAAWLKATHDSWQEIV